MITIIAELDEASANSPALQDESKAAADVTALGEKDRLPEVRAFAAGYFESQGLNHMDAQDLAVEVCLRWLALRDEGRDSSMAWLRVVGRHLLIDHWRRQQREQAVMALYAAGLPDAGENAPAKAGCFEELLAGLANGERELLLGHYAEGLAVKELACRHGVSVDCVKQRLHRARARLQTRFQGDRPRRVRRQP